MLGIYFMSLQEEFETNYITSAEVLEFVGCNRSALRYEVLSGRLPECILLNANGTTRLWRRTDMVPAMEAWKLRRDGKAVTA